MVVLFLCGKMGVGKNYVANRIASACSRKNLTCEQLMLAEGVKKGCEEDFARLAELLNSYAEEAANAGLPDLAKKLAIEPKNWWEEKTPITRVLLQSYGTDIFRNRVGKNYWTEQLLHRLADLKREKVDLAIVTDMRFPNECGYTRKMMPDDVVLSVMIDRDSCYKDEALFKHDSETALDNFYPDIFLVNDNDTHLDAVIDGWLKDFFKED